MIPNAPVAATRSTMIDAPVDTVWRLLTGVSEWPRWYGYLKNARLDGLFAAGSALTYGGLIKHRLIIAKVESCRLAIIYGTMAGYTGITRWDVQGVADRRTRVTFEESSAGPLISFLYGSRSLGRHLEQWLAALQTEAECAP